MGMVLWKDHLAKFHKMTDAKDMWIAIKSRFGGNDESKKMQKYILKQQFEGFSVSNSDGIHKGYERFQSLLSQLELHGCRIKEVPKKTGGKLQFDAKEPVGFDKTKVECYNCHKTGHFARECRSKEENRRRDGWNTRNREGRRTGNRDESITGKKEESKALVTVDGESVDWTTHSEDDDNYTFMANNNSGSNTQVTSCSNECKESYANIKRLYDTQREQLSDASVEIKAYTQGLKKVEAQCSNKTMLAKAQKEKDDLEVIVNKWNHSSKNLGKMINNHMSASDKFGLGYGDYRYSGNLSYENEISKSVFVCNKSDSENRTLHTRLVKPGEMQAVPPPMTGNYLPSGPDIEIDDSQYTYGPEKTQPSEPESQTNEHDTCDSNISTESSELVSEPGVSESNVEVQPKVWSDTPIIEEYESDSDDECMTVQTKGLDTPRENVKNQSTNSQKPKVNHKELGHGITQRGCFVCGSISHLIRDCDYHVKLAKQVELNKQNMSKGNDKGRGNQLGAMFKGQTVLTSTALKVNTVKPIVNGVRPANVFHKTHSPSSRPFKRTTVLRTNFSNQKVYTAKVKEVSTVGGKWDTADNPHRTLKNKGIIDSGCSRHMTGNKAYLADFQDFNGGPVAFGGSKGYITGKGKIKTGKLDFEDVSFVKELQPFNLFSVSQMCDKKNKVLFTDSECLVLSPDFKLPDENQILLKVPRQNNMYSFNLENIVPLGGLACLIAKATTDESNLWHRRLGHVNFKNLNRLVKGNLVRGLPTKLFQNDHTCVACQKGKQHKASCKAKLVSSISHTLQLLHMDLFGPTSVRSINHKTYCLVITDDFSRFSWTFFLRTKDETSAILKDFIRQIENQLNQKGSRGNTAMPELHNKMELLRERAGPLLRQQGPRLQCHLLPNTGWAEADCQQESNQYAGTKDKISGGDSGMNGYLRKGRKTKQNGQNWIGMEKDVKDKAKSSESLGFWAVVLETVGCLVAFGFACLVGLAGFGAGDFRILILHREVPLLGKVEWRLGSGVEVVQSLQSMFCQIPFVFCEGVDGLSKFFLHPFSIVDVSSIDNTPKDLHVYDFLGYPNLMDKVVKSIRSWEEGRPGYCRLRVAEERSLSVSLVSSNHCSSRLDTYTSRFTCQAISIPEFVEYDSRRSSRQRLSEYIRQLILCPHEIQLNHSFFHLFFDEMMSDADVFRPGVLNVVAAEGYGTLVVTVQRDAIMYFCECPVKLHDLRLSMLSRLGTSPELIGPGVNRLGAGPGLDYSVTFSDRMAYPMKITISALVCRFSDSRVIWRVTKSTQRPEKCSLPQLQPKETSVPLKRLALSELPRQEYGSVFRQRHSAVESLALSFDERFQRFIIIHTESC
ncbi:ribonuclease H-like domain-containing protein [Tanacetum coccineum]